MVQLPRVEITLKSRVYYVPMQSVHLGA